MRRSRLNLAALRARRLPEFRSPGLKGQLTATSPSLTFSRRQVLGLTGAAAISLRAFDEALLGPFTLQADAHRAVFKLGGRECWVIDSRRLAGSPVLKVDRREHAIRVVLRGARYPGTKIPADLACDLFRVAGGWRMKLRMGLQGFSSTVPFERWLAGLEPARGQIEVHHPLCEFAPGWSLKLSGRARVEFHPDWTLQLDGTRAARLTGPGCDIVSDRIEVALLDGKAPSALERPGARRTLIRMKRGAHKWRLEPNAGDAGPGRFVTTGSSFDSLQIELGETRRGAKQAALVAESPHAEAGLHFQPTGDLTDPWGTPFRLPLRNALYAAAFDRAGDHTALIARFASDPVWMVQGGCALQVGEGTNRPAFELVVRDGRVQAFRCAPALLMSYTPLPGAIVQATPAPDGEHVEFFASAAGQQRIQRPEVRLDTKRLTSLVALPSLSVAVLRPEDLLHLSFQFVNLKLEATRLESRLTRIQPDQSAFIRVDFPAQNIAEQAFFEAAEGYPLPKNPLTGQPDSDANKKRSDDLQEPPVASRLSGPSWLVFKVPGDVQQIPYTLEALLKACREYEQNLAPVALPPNLPGLPSESFRSCEPARRLPALDKEKRILIPPSQIQMRQPSTTTLRVATETPQARTQRATVTPKIVTTQMVAPMGQLLKIAPPQSTETAIECPYRLIVSPNRFAGWTHALAPVQDRQKKRTELWHTRLGVRCKDDQGNLRVDEARFAELRTLRAIWSPDYPANTRLAENQPFRMTLTGKDRFQIVELTANYSLKKGDGGAYQPDPVAVSRLMLSALGAWLDSRGVWEPPSGLSISEWRHLATMGRDHFVRVVYEGFLFPFGHRATLVKITERKFRLTPKSRRNAAYLMQRMFIVVREPEKEYPAYGQQFQGRKLPYLRLRTTTLVTPNLDIPQGIAPGAESTEAFWPRVGGQEFLFHFVGEDAEGQTSEFTTPVIFVQKNIAFLPTPNAALDAVFSNYQAAATNRQRELRGQKIAFAESTKPGDTTFETERIVFAAQPPSSEASVANLEAQNQPPFYPAVEEAHVRVATVEQVTGTDARTRIRFHDAYLNNGFASAQNKGQVFAELLDKVQLMFGGAGASTDRTGAFLAPNMNIGGLSRSLGAVGGALDKIVGGEFDPAEFFKGALGEAKILGGITLWDILELINDFTGLLDRVPKFITSRLPDAIETSFNWKATVKNGPDPGKPILKFANPQEALSVDARLRAPLTGQPPSYEVNAQLKNFEVHLVPQVLEVVVLKFKSLAFIAKNGQKPDVSVDFDNFEFKGPLEFIDTLRHYLPLDGFKDPPNLDITPQGLTLGYTLGLPALTVGVMSIQNINLEAECKLPFTGDPLSFRFEFCKRHDPFLLTVSIFGGGGFFGVELEPTGEGLKRLEGSFEFGGNFGLDIGVASGGVHLMAGIYFAITAQKTQLTGYVRCGGSVEVLGIICISVEFYLELSYVSPPSRAWGRATLTVEIEILFFSISVDLTVEREFAGSGAETAFVPAFGDGAPALPVTAALSVGDLLNADDWRVYCEAFA